MMWSRVERLAGAPPRRLEDLPWPAIRALQDEGEELLVIPLGATEQHGPHLPVNTDTIIAEAVCAYASAKTGVPAAPVQPYTVSIGHTSKWPGTFSLSPATFVEMLQSLGEWCLRTGWKRLLFVNSHFGNDASLRVAVDLLRTTYLGSLQVGLRHVFQLTPEIWQAYTEDADDLHANKAETDLMLFLAPEVVDMEAVADDPDRTAGTVFSYPVAQTSLNGVTGRPSEGDADDGRRLFLAMGEALATVLEEARNEEPPLPADHWHNLPHRSS